VRSTRLCLVLSGQLRDGRRPRDPPGREVGKPRIEDLAGPHQVVEAAHDLLDRRHAVGVVHPIEVDAVGPQPPQAGLEGGDHGLAAVAGDQDAGIRRRALGELGGENEGVAPAFQESPKQLLRLAELIAVGGVDEVATGLGIGVQNAVRLVGVGAVPPSRAEHPGPQHELGHAQAGVPAEDLVAHVNLLDVAGPDRGCVMLDDGHHHS
jgi:hypothetical protein